MADDGGIEAETGEFLYGLVKVLQPENILETGTYTGISAMYMAAGLEDNGRGTLETLEINEFHINRAKELWNKVGLSHRINSIHSKSLDFKPTKDYDLIFLDSEPEFRFKEAFEFFHNLKPGGYMLVHDLHRHLSQHANDEHGFGWPFGKLPEMIVDWIKEDKLRVFSFPTPRGLTGFYKPQESDYRVK